MSSNCSIVNGRWPVVLIGFIFFITLIRTQGYNLRNNSFLNVSTMINSRRNLTQALALSMLSSSLPVFAQADAKSEEAKLPFRNVHVPVDKAKILFFFDFSCKFCAVYHMPFLKWAATVPSGVLVTSIPVVNPHDQAKLKDQIIAARCYYAAAAIAKGNQLSVFITTVYDQIATGKEIHDRSVWVAAIQRSGIDSQRFGRGIKSNSHLLDIRFASDKVVAYDLRATPSVAIAGKHVVIPDDVNGDQQMFFNILNGLTSKSLSV